MSRPSKFGSNQANNRYQSCGPMLEGTVSVATNHMFSGSGLRGHHPDTNPNFSQKNQYCLMGEPKKGAPDGWRCGNIVASDGVNVKI